VLDLVIRDATLIDGTGTFRRRADVGVRAGRVKAVGEVRESARRVIDADGLVLAPGLIDVHTHFDAQLFWDPAATPSSLHGVTTVLGGNCGFTIAPLVSSQADHLMRTLARVEGMPLETLQIGVPWTWRTFGEYLAALDGRVAVNAGFLVGHSTIRRVALGSDDEREATRTEVERMVGLLRESLEGGALGFSSSLATSHNDADGRPVSSRYASSAELIALCAATGQHDGTTLEFIPSVGAYFSDAEIDLMACMSAAADRSLNWNLLHVNRLMRDGSMQRLGASDLAAAVGGRVVALTLPMNSTLRVNFESGFVLDSFPGWEDLFTLPLEARARELATRERRARMRAGVEQHDSVLTRRVRDWASLVITQTFAPGVRDVEGLTVGVVAQRHGADPFDCLLDIVLDDGLRTVITIPPVDDDAESWQLRARLWRDERVVIGGSDAGAHLDMIDTFSYPSHLLGPVCRSGLVDLEHAVKLMTDVPARLYGLRDRGRVAVGHFADLLLFDPDAVGPGTIHLRDDLPGGASRLYSSTVGIARVFVNGTEIVVDGKVTGAMPGRVLRSGIDTDTVRASSPGSAPT
jgi:N-acyl-D-aspartate/D-glutamate deacylase